jgi:hypothetical protein
MSPQPTKKPTGRISRYCARAGGCTQKIVEFISTQFARWKSDAR